MAEFLTSSDSAYEAELAGFNTAYPLRPAVVVPAASEAEVIEAVAYARARGLTVTAFATGHGTSAPLEGGMVINLSRVADVAIDPLARTARVGGGTRWAAVVAAAAQHGLAPVTGSSTSVGVVGYLMGGGLGPLSRSHGFSSDWVRGFRLVTGTGELVAANAEENPELFWALRGGKGGFGIVTEVTVELVPAHSVYGGAVTFAEEHIEQALRAWVDYTDTAPTEATTSAIIINFPPFDEVPAPLRGRRLLMVRFAYVGDSATGERLAAPIHALAPVYLDGIRELALTEVAQIHNDPTDPGPGWGLGTMLTAIDDDFASALLAFMGAGSAAPFIAVEVRQLGAATLVDVPEGSAVGGRASAFTMHLIGAPDPSLFEAVLPSAGAGFLSTVQRWLSPEGTINFTDASDPVAFRAAWPAETFDRLAAVRARLDPDTVFPFGPAHA